MNVEKTPSEVSIIETVKIDEFGSTIMNILQQEQHQQDTENTKPGRQFRNDS